MTPLIVELLLKVSHRLSLWDADQVDLGSLIAPLRLRTETAWRPSRLDNRFFASIIRS
jgi:hypothetical protein